MQSLFQRIFSLLVLKTVKNSISATRKQWPLNDTANCRGGIDVSQQNHWKIMAIIGMVESEFIDLIKLRAAYEKHNTL